MLSINSILSLLTLSALTLALQNAQAPLHNPNTPSDLAVKYSYIHTSEPSCPIDGPLSCHNTTAVENCPYRVDCCCFIYPGGQMLLTQFWDTRPSIGPNNSWTLHGLWPDLCDGRYESFCNISPRYANISEILIQHNRADLLQTMLEYWLPNRGSPESFWQHEWNKHGTCINTLRPSCYLPKIPDSMMEVVIDDMGDYKFGQEVVDYFARAVRLFKQLNTFQALADAGIVPSTTRRYTKREISEALLNVTGAPPVLGCQRGALNEVWYTFNVRGNLQSGAFVATEPAGTGKGTCPERGIRWWPKDN